MITGYTFYFIVLGSKGYEFGSNAQTILYRKLQPSFYMRKNIEDWMKDYPQYYNKDLL